MTDKQNDVPPHLSAVTMAHLPILTAPAITLTDAIATVYARVLELEKEAGLPAEGTDEWKAREARIEVTFQRLRKMILDRVAKDTAEATARAETK